MALQAELQAAAKVQESFSRALAKLQRDQSAMKSAVEASGVARARAIVPDVNPLPNVDPLPSADPLPNVDPVPDVEQVDDGEPAVDGIYSPPPFCFALFLLFAL